MMYVIKKIPSKILGQSSRPFFTGFVRSGQGLKACWTEREEDALKTGWLMALAITDYWPVGDVEAVPCSDR